MTTLLGEWKLESTENFDQFLQDQGLNKNYSLRNFFISKLEMT